MAQRSTRNRIKYQGDQIDRYFGRIIDSMRYLDDLAGQQSPFINNNLPELLAIVESARILWANFKERL